MISEILATISGWVTGAISAGGYGAVVLLMLIESAGIPAPSEVIMPFSGFAAAQGNFNLWWVGLAGAVGNLLGSWLAYWIGARGGRPLIEKYGKYILISKHDLDIADSWFQRWGKQTAFFSRLLPIVRTYISFPAGIAKMDFWQFSIYTFLGALPWSLALTYIGFVMGENWESLKDYFHNVDYLIAAILIIGLAYFISRHFKQSR